MTVPDTTTNDTNGAEATSYDYIVVGGGTAGVVVASRLTEDPEVTVLVIEAGPDNSTDPLVLTPGLVAALYGNDKYDWNFTSTPQPTLNNRTINQARGRMLGGSSALNFMMAAYPSRAIIDAWGALGNDGWSYDAVEPYLRKFATTHEPSASAREIARLDGHYDEVVTKAESGPLQVSFSEGYTGNNSAWFDTFAKLGLQMTTDPRSGAAVGAFQNPATIDPATKTRSFAASAYLTPDVRKRDNLVILTETLVSKLVLETSSEGQVTATGVQVRTKDGAEKTIKARNEVVLAAGALHSPQILELSGVGGKDLLEKHGIPVIVDNPNVGEHMQDHPIVIQSFEVADGVPSGDVLRDPNVLQAVVAQFQGSQEGPMGQSLISCAYVPIIDKDGPLDSEARKAFFKENLSATPPAALSESASAARDLEHKVMASLLTQTNEPSIQFLLFPTQVSVPVNPKHMADLIIPVEPENFITIMSTLNHPFSRGSCHIISADVADKPRWDPSYNAEAADLEILARAVRFVETLAATQPFAGLLREGGRRLPAVRATDLEKAREIVRERQVSVFHVSSSCAMLPRELGGVVDGRLRVHGVRGLRVVDASVFPLEPLGNIQTTVYAVAERAADLIKEDRKAGSV